MDYLLKASAILGIFYLFYKFVLQRETFFQSNRIFLLIGLFSALIIPFIDIPIYIEPTVFSVQDFSIIEDNTTKVSHEIINWSQLVLLIYFSGVLFFGTKLLLSILSLGKLLITSPKEKIDNFYFIKSHTNDSPFSFFNYIVYNDNLFESKELNQILIHEKVHAYQWHSLDVLLSQLATVLFWFNPFSWLYKKELQQNLEFIADAISQGTSSCEKTYQQLLLKTSISKNQFALTNNFYNSLIKKRILMLHKNRSKKVNQWKFALILPLLFAFVFTFNTKIIAQESSEKEHKNHVVEENVQMVIITKGASDESLEKIKNNFSKEGITLKFKGVKRNDGGEITAIKIEANSKQANANFNVNSDKPIEPIKISLNAEGGNISIGNANMHSKVDYMFISKDGNHKVHSSGKGSQQFVFISDDDNQQKSNKIIEIKGDGENVFIIKSDGNEELHEISEDGNHHVIKIKNGDGDENIWITKKENTKVEVIGGDDDHKMIFISDNDSESKPLIFVDGKESSTNIEDLDPNKIESVKVLKGESVIKKYGEKGKNGVIEITTKKE